MADRLQNDTWAKTLLSKIDVEKIRAQNATEDDDDDEDGRHQPTKRGASYFLGQVLGPYMGTDSHGVPFLLI